MEKLYTINNEDMRRMVCEIMKDMIPFKNRDWIRKEGEHYFKRASNQTLFIFYNASLNIVYRKQSYHICDTYMNSPPSLHDVHWLDEHYVHPKVELARMQELLRLVRFYHQVDLELPELSSKFAFPLDCNIDDESSTVNNTAALSGSCGLITEMAFDSNDLTKGLNWIKEPQVHPARRNGCNDSFLHLEETAYAMSDLPDVASTENLELPDITTILRKDEECEAYDASSPSSRSRLPLSASSFSSSSNDSDDAPSWINWTSPLEELYKSPSFNC